MSPLRVLKEAIAIVALFLLNKAGMPGTIAFFVILLSMALRSSASAFMAMAIVYLGMGINLALVPKPAIWTIARMILLFVCFLRFRYDASKSLRTRSVFPIHGALIAYCSTMALCSIMSGWYTQIALLKLVNFWFFVGTVFCGVAVLRKRGIDLTEWFIALITATTLIGFLAMELGQADAFVRGDEICYGKHFVGAFSHPNSHALYGSLFVAFLLTIMVFGAYRNRIPLTVLIGLWIMFMYYSKSRTSFLATAIIPIVILFYAAPSRIRVGVWRLRVNISRGMLATIILITAVALKGYDMQSRGAVSQAAIRFINKSGSDFASGLDRVQVLKSRQALIDESMANFREHPIIGIGFQVSKSDYFINNATLITAPAEKGFLPSAVLEEGGVVGAIAFVIFMITLIGLMVRQKNIPGQVLFLTFLASSWTEVTIFSVAGPGGFGWIMTGAAMIMADHCLRPPAAALGKK